MFIFIGIYMKIIDKHCY